MDQIDIQLEALTDAAGDRSALRRAEGALLLAIAVIEAAGSVTHPFVPAVFARLGIPNAAAETLAALLPVSRGGPMRGPGPECIWEERVDQVTERLGDDFIDQLRTEFDEIARQVRCKDANATSDAPSQAA